MLHIGHWFKVKHCIRFWTIFYARFLATFKKIFSHTFKTHRHKHRHYMSRQKWNNKSISTWWFSFINRSVWDQRFAISLDSMSWCHMTTHIHTHTLALKLTHFSPLERRAHHLWLKIRKETVDLLWHNWWMSSSYRCFFDWKQLLTKFWQIYDEKYIEN